MGTFTNSEDPDELLHNAAFHLVLHCLYRYIFCKKKKRSSDKRIHVQYFVCLWKKIFRQKNTIFFYIITWQP